MTEKRFWFVIDKGKLDYVQDNVSKEKITVSELEDLLNELFEEREYFERKKEYFLSKWSIAHAENIQLRQENKELKAEIEQSDLISEDIVCADIQHQLLKVTDENKELKIENRQLKRQNNALKDSSLIDPYNQYIRNCTVQSNRE